MRSVTGLIKAHTSRGIRNAVKKANLEWRTYRQHRLALRRVNKFLHLTEKKLNLGCGPNRKEGWINIDLFDSRADLQLDLRETWPFDDGTIAYIYSEHIFEHFDLHQEVPNFLSESHRVLRPGGVLDAGVPDTDWTLRAYGDPSDSYWPWARAIHPKWCETQLEHINYHFRQDGEHKYAWDEETLTKTLRNFRFSDITRRDFDPALDSPSRKTGTLYMRAIKPVCS